MSELEALRAEVLLLRAVVSSHGQRPAPGKSPFRVLLEQASALGVEGLTFKVNVKGYTENNERRWQAWETLTPGAKTFSGTNGQHALTELVAAKRASAKGGE